MIYSMFAKADTSSRLTATEIESSFVSSLNKAQFSDVPYPYWLMDNILPPGMPDMIADLPIQPAQNLSFYGRRETNNASRIYFTPENQSKYPVCAAMVEAFKGMSVINAIKSATGRDVSAGHLRIEYCQDTDGFWLEPHVDISVKLFTMLIYISDDPDLRDAGTDIYDSTPDHNIIATSEYARNKGLIFIPGHNTWHGFSKRPIKGLRQSLIINYVSDQWKERGELA